MRFERLADELDELALHYRAEGHGKIAHQYTKASEAVREASFLPPDPSNLHGIGQSIRDDIAEYRAYGEISRLEVLREKRPYLSELCQISKVGPKTAQRLYDEKDAETVSDVRDLIEREELEDVTGIGPKTATTIRRSIAQLDR